MPLLIHLLGCGPGDAVGDVRDDSARSSGLVPLTWYRSEPQETWADAAAGLDWALSQLGALPPPDGALLVDEVAADRVRFRLDLDALALPDPARNVLEITAAELEAHPGTGSDDLGRFLLRSLHEPWRYLAATGACATLADWRATRPVESVVYAVTTSLLTSGERRITLPDAAADWSTIAMFAEEGEGSLVTGDFAPVEAETVDVMPNGQFRYAVYGADGALLPAATASPAGTPGKCAWCHEATLEAGTSANASAPGYLDYAAWITRRDADQALIEDYRASLATSIAYATPVVHESGERLVEGFLLPDAARVAREWGMTEAEVVAVLGEGTESLDELGWTGRYRRADVDAAAPWSSAIRTLSNVREQVPGETFAPAEVGGCR